MRKLIFMATMLAGLCITDLTHLQAQQLPEVGKPFPEIVVRNVRNYSKKQATPSHFRGKWLVVDMWSLGCTSCLTGFKVIKEVDEKYHDDVSFLLVGKKDRKYNQDIESIFDRISDNMKLNVPAGFDTTLFKTWKITAVPVLYIIRPDGILHSITSGVDFSTEKVAKLIRGENVTFYPLEPDPIPLETNKEVTVRNTISKSLGTTYHEDIEFAHLRELKQPLHKWSVTNVPLEALYYYAYFGKSSWTQFDTAYYGKVNLHPVLEMEDTSLFTYDYKRYPSSGTFDCSVEIASRNLDANLMMETLKQMLYQAFSYQVTVELRDAPVWKLVAKPEAGKKLKSRGGERYVTTSSAAGGFVLVDRPMRDLLRLLTAHYSGETIPFLDETGISHNVDFFIEADMTDFSEVQHEIQKYGLSFVRGTRPMQTLVLKKVVSQ